MSTDSSLIVRRDALPTVQELVAALAETGVSMSFPKDFALDRNLGGWAHVRVDGADSGFHYGVFSFEDYPAEDLPQGVDELGDTVLSFSASGSLSAETVSLIQMVLGRRWRAALMIEDEVLPPEAGWGPGASLADLHADRYGSPAQRAAELDARIAAITASQVGDAKPARGRNASARAALIVIPILLAIVAYLIWDVFN